MRIYFTLTLLIFHTLQGQLADHLKKCPNKADNHKIDNIDFIYVINLDRRPDRWKKTCSQLHPYEIYPYRFSAVCGWDLTIDDINDVGLKYTPEMQGGFMATSYHHKDNFKPSHEIIENFGQTYFVHCMARGTIGIALSHLSVLQDAYDSGYETIWVMEDDIEVIRDPRIIPDLISKLDAKVGYGNWDLLFTDRDIRNHEGSYTPCAGAARRPNFYPKKPNNYQLKAKVGKEFIKTGARFGATSIIYRRSGIEKILNFIKEYSIFLPYDMEFYLPPGIQLFTVKNDVISNQRDSLSDNGVQNYLKIEKESTL